MLLLLIFVIGIFVGSFLNVVVDRLPRKETIAKGKSHCEFCKKELAWYDLIPLLSFLLLKGKCRYCHKKLSLYYPIIELSTGVLFVLAYVYINSQFSILNFQLINQFLIPNLSIFNLQSLISLVYYLFIVSSFIVVFFSDLKYGIIPDKIVFPAIVVTFFYLLIINPQSLIINLFSALGAWAFFLILFLITRGKGMGFGDVKLAFLLGLILGFPKIILALYLAFLTGAFLGIILILCKKKKSIKETIPFGPFLIIGSLIALFWGEFIYPYVLTFFGI